VSLTGGGIMARKDTPTIAPAGRSDPSKASFAATRLGQLLVQIRERLSKLPDRMDSAGSEAVLDGPLAGLPADIEAAAGYLVDVGLEPDGRRLRGEWRRFEQEGIYFAALVRQPPPALHYEASPDDPDDPWLADFNQRSAESLANYQRETNRQRGVVMYALSDLSVHVDELIRTVNVILASKPPAAVAITVDEANAAAMKLAKQDAGFIQKGIREWAARIGKATDKQCSTKVVGNTPFWIKTMEETDRGREKGKRQSRPQAVSLIEAATGAGERHEVLKRLTEEQEVDFEPSPLEEDSPDEPRRVHCRKRV
jgi:hypothetical protein